MSNTFLTFLIITYKRPIKVKRLLDQFLNSAWEEIYNLNLEIIVADDNSNDDTASTIQPTILLLRKLGWNIKYLNRDINLRGDLNLYKGIVDDSNGEYTWLLCDDDCLNISESIDFIKAIFKHRPIVAICGFKQGNLTKYTNSLGDKLSISYDFEESVKLLSHYPKTSTYVFKRRLEDLNYEYFKRWDGTLFAWIGLGIYMAGKNIKDGVLAYPKLTVFADEDYGVLRYSYRVFKNLRLVIQDSIQLLGYDINTFKNNSNLLVQEDESALNILGLQAHYSLKSDIKYSDSILLEETLFFKRNFLKIFFKKKRFVLALKLLFVRIVRLFLLFDKFKIDKNK
jgi:glycosyltransferase involved in cell wall biosynthesis